MRRDVHPPETMMHFPSVSDFPLFSKKFQTLRKIFTILPFPQKFLYFHHPKFFMTFFSHRPQISNFPLFSLFQYISPLFRENYYFPPTLTNFPLVLDKFILFLYTFRVFSFPLLLPYFFYYILI